MSEPEPSGPDSSRVQNLLVTMGLVIAAHLPFFVLHHRRLWDKEHYQFFPFAFVAFGWLLTSRRIPGVVRWDHWNSLLVVLDLLLLAGAVIMLSPLLACVGLLFTLLAVCRSQLDTDRQSSLWYLILLPLITIRPPSGLDLDMINQLQRITTATASELLNYFGYLHLRVGNVLEFPGKQFLVEEACSGVQSLFTLLFLAALVVTAYRRPMLHGVLVLASAACLAGVMNILRVSAIAIAHVSYSVDLSSGWRHETIGYVALIVAALLVVSADALFEFLLGLVPDLPGAGVRAIYRNPLSGMWNWMFYRRRRRNPEAMPDETAFRLPAGKATLSAAAVICMAAVALQMMKLLG